MLLEVVDEIILLFASLYITYFVGSIEEGKITFLVCVQYMYEVTHISMFALWRKTPLHSYIVMHMMSPAQGPFLWLLRASVSCVTSAVVIVVVIDSEKGR